MIKKEFGNKDDGPRSRVAAARRADKKTKKAGDKKVKEEDEDSEDWQEDDSLGESDSDFEADGTRRVKDEVLKVKYPAEDIKLVLIVRDDLKMGKGKVGA
jgi:hypothetical protein